MEEKIGILLLLTSAKVGRDGHGRRPSGPRRHDPRRSQVPMGIVLPCCASAGGGHQDESRGSRINKRRVSIFSSSVNGKYKTANGVGGGRRRTGAPGHRGGLVRVPGRSKHRARLLLQRKVNPTGRQQRQQQQQKPPLHCRYVSHTHPPFLSFLPDALAVASLPN
jgi:hypothetical protein